MTPDERIVRTSPQMGISVRSIIESLMVSEFLAPSEEMWLVSPWISDVAVLDNSGGDYDALLLGSPARMITLAETLGNLARVGIRLTVVCRDDAHNIAFRTRLLRASHGAVRVVLHDDLHEKTWVGSDWLLTGSMNFTYRGIAVNDESVTYKVTAPAAATARLDFNHRWPT